MNCIVVYVYTCMYIILCIILFILATVVLPLPTHVAVLAVLMFAHGVCLGAQNNGEACLILHVSLKYSCVFVDCKK